MDTTTTDEPTDEEQRITAIVDARTYAAMAPLLARIEALERYATNLERTLDDRIAGVGRTQATSLGRV